VAEVFRDLPATAMVAALEDGIVFPLHEGCLGYCQSAVPACGECEYMMTGVE